MELRFFATLFLWVHRYGTHQHGMSSAIRRHAIEVAALHGSAPVPEIRQRN